MFSWGEDSQRGFKLKGGLFADSKADDGVGFLDLGCHVVDLSAGRDVLAFVKSNGNAFIIRTNVSNDGRRVRGKQKFVDLREKIRAVTCSDDSVTLLSHGGAVFCVDGTRSYIPRPLEALCNIPVSHVASGSQHSVALTKVLSEIRSRPSPVRQERQYGAHADFSTDGQVYTWGHDSRGQLGFGRTKLGSSSPQHLRCLSAIPLVQIAAGGEQSFALSGSGGVFGWGRNDCGQLGLGDRTDRHTPTPVHCLNMKKSVHISCGKDHTVILTKDGVVFTFGSGQYGQLGHNSFNNELQPRLVAELWGTKVTGTACGQYHTLVLTDSRRVYSFGRGEQGQLGHGDESHPSVPLPVQLPKDAADNLKVRHIFAGYNLSFATCTSNEEVDEESNSASSNNGTQHCLNGLIDKWTSECNSKTWRKTKQEIHRTFSSACCVNKSFLDQSKDKHFQTSPKYSGLNLSRAQHAFKKLAKKDSVLAEVEAALLHLLPLLDKQPVAVEGLRIYLLLNELLHVIQRHKQQQTSTKLAEAVAASVIRLSDDCLQVIGDWWSLLSPSRMVKHVKVWKKAVSVVLSFNPVPRSSGVRNLLQVLQYMYNANSGISKPRRLPDSDFCVLTNKDFLNEELLLWRSHSKHKNAHTEPLILCSFPIVMDLQSKKLVFDMNTYYTKLESVEMRTFRVVFWDNRFPLPNDLLFILNLRRALILQDTFEQLAAAHHSDYKSKLVVYFDANHTFDEVHSADFFYEVFHKLVSPESGMFMFNDSETLAWFASKVTQDDQRFFQFGVLCGLALYNDCIIHLPFPLALFKKLLGVKPSLEDFMEFSPCNGKSLQYILEDYNDEDLKDMDIYFKITWDGTEVDLDPKNPEKPVTCKNKKKFVDAYVNHVFNISVEGVFQEFKRGFFQVCDQKLVKLFQPEELQKVLVGEDFHDWEKLKQNTAYEGEYHDGHPNIKMFWEVFDELSDDQKKAFLWFVTGFERKPIRGMEKIKMTVRVKQEDQSYDQYYPETHTCFSMLDLPLYSTKEIMKNKLTEALSNNKRNNK